MTWKLRAAAIVAALVLCGRATYADSVVFSTGFESVAHSFPDDTGRHIIELSSSASINKQKRKSGTSSLRSAGNGHNFTLFYTSRLNTSRANVDRSEDWNISPSAEAAFKIEYWHQQEDDESVYDALTTGMGFAGSGWSARHNGQGIQFAWFDQSGVHHTIDADNVGWIPRTWHRVTWEKHRNGMLRIYLDGVLKALGAVGIIRASMAPLRLNVARRATAYMDDVRIIKSLPEK